MGFSEAQFNAVIDKINSGMQTMSQKTDSVIPTANSAMNHWYIPGFVKDAVMALCRKLVDIAKAIWDKIVEILKGVAAPVMFFKYAWDWMDVRSTATTVAGQLKPEVLQTDAHWKGVAADRYKAVTGAQSAAAEKVGSIAEKTAISLGVCAVAGCAFYVAIGVIIVKFIAVLIASIAAVGTIVLSWAGLGMVVADAGISSGLIIAAVTTLGALLTAQAAQMVTLHGEATDNSKFPGGKWPDPTTGTFNDATVTDGDADWSFKN
ncbi:MAG: hypothetical protein ABW224_12320 [Kibdelosporangium sp.]